MAAGQLEGVARRQTGRREVIPLAGLLAAGSSGGASSLGLDSWPETAVNLSHPSLAGVAREDVAAALVFSCAADVFRA